MSWIKWIGSVRCPRWYWGICEVAEKKRLPIEDGVTSVLLYGSEMGPVAERRYEKTIRFWTSVFLLYCSKIFLNRSRKICQELHHRARFIEQKLSLRSLGNVSRIPADRLSRYALSSLLLFTFSCSFSMFLTKLWEKTMQGVDHDLV